MTIYTLTIVSTSIEDEASITTYAFRDMESARNKFQEEESAWIEGLREMEVDHYEMDQEAFDEWILNAISRDMYHANGLYKSYIYNGGEEKIFTITMHEI